MAKIEAEEEEWVPKCSICDIDYNEEEGGIQGYFGILPVTFCCWCYSSLVDMIGQLEIPEEATNG
jgi:hypothetical protein